MTEGRGISHVGLTSNTTTDESRGLRGNEGKFARRRFSSPALRATPPADGRGIFEAMTEGEFYSCRRASMGCNRAARAAG